MRGQGAELAGILIAMDRRERGTGPTSAIREIELEYSTRVVSVVALQDVIDYLGADPGSELHSHLDAVRGLSRALRRRVNAVRISR